MHIPKSFVIPVPEGYVGHPHFWERALTRRQFMGTTALVGGAAMTAPLWSSAIAQAATMVDPRPIPQTIAPGAPFHVQLLSTTSEPSTITDFRGTIGGADLLGRGWATDTETNETRHLWTAIDNRFMQGTYVGVDGKRHHGTFGFV
jgi:hypothetical protein